MRKILFRGKAIYGSWVYGSLIQARDFCCILDSDDEDDMEYPYLDGYLGVIDGYATPVKFETIGQFIGIHDKNGKRIFEGDIVKFHMFRDEPDYVGIIKYDSSVCLYLLVGNNPSLGMFEVQVSSRDKSSFEVIGNIHDNPELLGEEI